MRARGEALRRRADSLLFRIRGLIGLRQLVNLSSEQDITQRQWSVIEMQLNAASARLTARTKAATDRLLPRAGESSARRKLHAALGQIVTGLLYVDPEADDLHGHFDTIKTPLNQLGEAALCPGSAALHKLNASLR